MASILALLLFNSLVHQAQDLGPLKAGVVRIENSRYNGVTGAGFIIKIRGRSVYIITAGHVVRGSQTHRIYLYSQQQEPFSAEVVNVQPDPDKGLALLLLRTDEQIASGLIAIKMGLTSELGNGESVKLIGFPGTTFWTVDSGSVVRVQGNELVLSGANREGNSGGPVIMNQQAIGLVTDVVGSDTYATRAEIIVLYVNGTVSKLIDENTLSILSPTRERPTMACAQHYISYWMQVKIISYLSKDRREILRNSIQRNSILLSSSPELPTGMLFHPTKFAIAC